MDMATSVNSFYASCPPKQPLKTVNRSPKFLRNAYNSKGNAAKRKSAVELLQESKAYYVKSEHVLDSKQELKHTEHLQVTSSYPSSYNTRLRNPHRPLSGGSDVSSSCQQVATSPLSQQSQVIGIEQKMLAVTISYNGNNATSCQRQKAFQSGKFNTVGPSSLTRTQSATSKNGTNIIHENVVNGKSPRSPHLRSKTQPEVTLRSHVHDYRRSHSELEHSNDIQMKLRKLLNTDSKENLSVRPETVSNGEDNENHHEPETAEPFIQARHQQDLGNYCIHKSMPDLSAGRSYTIKNVANHCDVEGENNSSDESFILAAKSVDLRPSSSWTTSDYASRSPSSRKEIDENHTFNNNNDSYEGSQENGASGMDLQSMTTMSSPDGTAKRRPILRSKSDISHRYSKSGTDLSQTGSSPKKSNTKAGAELERFFDTFGLDSSALAMLQSLASDTGSVIFFDSVSTESSSGLAAGGRHRGSDDEEEDQTDGGEHVNGTAAKQRNSVVGITNKDLLLHGPLETSIVERNARVIKWLYNCRKLNSNRRDSAD
ncbi:hypothetical protein CHUAL_013033 [Chamberlinius hualienensis]